MVHGLPVKKIKNLFAFFVFVDVKVLLPKPVPALLSPLLNSMEFCSVAAAATAAAEKRPFLYRVLCSESESTMQLVLDRAA